MTSGKPTLSHPPIKQNKLNRMKSCGHKRFWLDQNQIQAENVEDKRKNEYVYINDYWFYESPGKEQKYPTLTQ